MNTRTNEPSIEKILISGDDIQERIKQLARQISEDYEGKVPILISVLKGGVLFLSDLMRELTVLHEIDFMSVSSYDGGMDTTGVVRILADLSINIEGKDVLIVEDIVDTGLTLDYIRHLLLGRHPESLKIVTLLDKKERRRIDVPIDYVGFEIPDAFVIGYGLDYQQKYRNLPYIAIMKPDV
jgi:hypoxanthine phosphoribosyltransferase